MIGVKGLGQRHAIAALLRHSARRVRQAASAALDALGKTWAGAVAEKMREDEQLMLRMACPFFLQCFSQDRSHSKYCKIIDHGYYRGYMIACDAKSEATPFNILPSKQNRRRFYLMVAETETDGFPRGCIDCGALDRDVFVQRWNRDIWMQDSREGTWKWEGGTLLHVCLNRKLHVGRNGYFCMQETTGPAAFAVDIVEPIF